jgi:Xaa-Pro dipeptidase
VVVNRDGAGVLDAIQRLRPPSFPAEEYEARLARVFPELAHRGIDAILATSPDDIYWLSGYDSFGFYQFQGVILTNHASRPILFIHELEAAFARETAWVDEVITWAHSGQHELATAPGDPVGQCARILQKLGLGEARIGVSKNTLASAVLERLCAALPQATWLDTSDIVPELRVVKSPREVQHVRTAARFADAGMRACVETAAAGRSELDVLTAL